MKNIISFLKRLGNHPGRLDARSPIKVLIRRLTRKVEIKQLVPDDDDEEIMSGDRLLVLGSDENIDSLRHI